MTEIEELRATLADHGRRLAALERGPVAAPVREQEGARMITPAPRKFSMPTSAEACKLLQIVTARWPMLEPPAGVTDEEHFNEVMSALAYVTTRRRLAAPDQRRSVQSWVDRAEQFARDTSRYTTVRVRNFTAAVVMSGDVPFADIENMPYDLAFALSEIERDSGGGEWRSVLAGKTLDPVTVRKRSSA
jgi:hypothetical protein